MRLSPNFELKVAREAVVIIVLEIAERSCRSWVEQGTRNQRPVDEPMWNRVELLWRQ